MFFLNP